MFFPVMLLFGRSSVRTDLARVTRSWRPYLRHPCSHRPLALRRLRAALPALRRLRAALPALRRLPTPPIAVVHHPPVALLPRSVPLMSSTPATFMPLRSIKLHAGVELRIEEPPISSKQQVDVALESVCCKCLLSSVLMFQRYVAKVDQDIAYVAMIVYVCCKVLF
jgi:hypothetical protein